MKKQCAVCYKSLYINYFYQSNVGYVCGKDDRRIGRKNLADAGWNKEIAIMWETNPARAEYLHELATLG